MVKLNQTIVTYKNGFANVVMGDRKMVITRQDNDSPDYMCPVELIPAAIGSWISLTISAVAEHKEIALEDIEVRIQRDTRINNGVNTDFFIEIKLTGDLDERERILLFNSARKCDVTKIMNGTTDFKYRLQE